MEVKESRFKHDLGVKDARIESLLARVKKVQEEKSRVVREANLARQRLTELQGETERLSEINDKLKQEKETLMMEVSV